jgi:hypothetical protein
MTQIEERDRAASLESELSAQKEAASQACTHSLVTS